MKMNNLSDDGIVNALYDASQRGVKVDLIVRSICTLRPGVKSLSKNITVRSILGRFLEHSRIYYFENGGDEQIYIGSADMMPRNLDCACRGARDREVARAARAAEAGARPRAVRQLLRVVPRPRRQLDKVSPQRGRDAPRLPGAADAPLRRSMLEQELKLSVEGAFAPTLPARTQRRRRRRGAARARPARDLLRHPGPAAGAQRRDAAQPQRGGRRTRAGP